MPSNPDVPPLRRFARAASALACAAALHAVALAQTAASAEPPSGGVVLPDPFGTPRRIWVSGLVALCFFLALRTVLRMRAARRPESAPPDPAATAQSPEPVPAEEIAAAKVDVP